MQPVLYNLEEGVFPYLAIILLKSVIWVAVVVDSEVTSVSAIKNTWHDQYQNNSCWLHSITAKTTTGIADGHYWDIGHTVIFAVLVAMLLKKFTNVDMFCKCQIHLITHFFHRGLNEQKLHLIFKLLQT